MISRSATEEFYFIEEMKAEICKLILKETGCAEHGLKTIGAVIKEPDLAGIVAVADLKRVGKALEKVVR